MLELRSLDVVYGDFQVLWNVNLTVNQGEIVCVLGPNGAGKSTVLNAIVGLAPRRAGKVIFEGQDFPTCRRTRWRAAALRSCWSDTACSPV